jgi:hypothetical protein
MLPAATEVPPASSAPDAGWLNARRFAALLAVLVLASYPQVLLGFQTLVYRDFGYFSCPIAFYLRECFWRGELPLWNPLSSCGTPFLAQWNTQVLYPPALIYMLLPVPQSLGVFCPGHLFLAGLGMYLLVFNWTQNRLAAGFAGVVFAFNGILQNSLTLPPLVAGLAWMPWVVWLTERAWKRGGSAVLAAALVGTLQMLSGAAEVVLMTWLWLGALVVIGFIEAGTARLQRVGRAGLVVLIITGLCAAQLLPFFDLLKHSQRQENFNAAEWPMPATGWLNFLVPIFHCRVFQGGVFMQLRQGWTASYYTGVATVGLAAAAACCRRNRRTWLLLAAVLICLILAMGDATPVYHWLRQHVGVIALMRYPIKFVILAVFALPLLAAFALTARPGNGPTADPPSNRQWFIIWASIVASIAGIVWWSYRSAEPGDEPAAVLRNGAVRAALFTVILGILWVLKRSLPDKLRVRLQLFLLLLVWFDLYRQAPQPPTVKCSLYAPNPLRFAPATPSPGVARAMIPPSVLDEFFHAYLPDVNDDYASRRFALFANCNLLDNISKCDGFFPLDLREQLPFTAVEPTPSLLDFLGVSQVLVLDGNNFNWQARSTFLPLITGGQQPVFADENAAVQQVIGTNFNPRQEVFLPVEAKSFAAAVVPATVNILSSNFSGQRIEARVQAAAPAVVVFAQTYYHPWHAYVDGRPTPLWRANYGFQAVLIPAGEHQVRLCYEDGAFRTGVIISTITLTVCLIFWYRLRRSERVLVSTA